MISGIKLPIKPFMKGVSLSMVMADLDILKKQVPELVHKANSGATVKRTTCTGKKYMTTIIQYSVPNDSGFKAAESLFKVITDTLPDFVSLNRFSDKILLVSYPRFNDWRLNESYSSLMQEVQRIALFFISMYGTEDAIVKELLRKYINLFVDYPNDKD